MALTDGNIRIGTSVDVGGITSGLYRIQKSFKFLGKSLTALSLGAGGFIALGKAAIDAASELQEVQNIIDVTFTTLDEAGNIVEDVSYKIEEFAQNSIENFGMSEFAAKQTAGSFMAMGKAMGFSLEDASNMAVKLTGLSGDMASFYNISQDYARVALSAVYTGETETLKRYGIMLTEANLQEYASTLGITEKVKAMDAQEKALLRYNYVLSVTKDVEGDFKRTQGNWANQVRVLTEQWRQFLVVMGSGLISILTPFLQALNAILAKLIQFVQVLWVVLSQIFGFNLQDISEALKGIGDDAGSASGDIGDIGDELETAAKKAKKALQPFDELNNLTSKAAGSAGSGGGIDLPIGSIGGSGGLIKALKDKLIPDIKDLYELGKWIGEKLCEMLENIDWEKVYEGARNFGKGLAQFLNGLISTNLFKDLGHTIAGALNAVVYAALAFAEEFDWHQFGDKLAEGVNEFFYTFDFASLGKAVRAWVLGIWETLATFFSELDYAAIFKGAKDFFSNLGVDGAIGLLGLLTLKTLIRLAFKKVLSFSFKDLLITGLLHPLLNGLSYVSGRIEAEFSVFFRYLLPAFSRNLATFMRALPIRWKLWWQFTGADIISQIGAFFSSIWAAITSGFNSFMGGLSTLFTNLSLGNSLNASLTYAFGGVATTIAGVISLIGGAVLAVAEFVNMWIEGFSWLKEILMILGIILGVIGAIVLGASALPAIIVGGVIALLATVVILVKDNWNEIKTFIINSVKWISNNIVTPIKAKLQELLSWLNSNIIEPVKNKFSEIADEITDKVIDPVMTKLQPVFEFTEGVLKRIQQLIKGIIVIVEALVLITLDKVKSKFNEVKNIAVDVLENIKIQFNLLKMVIQDVFINLPYIVSSSIEAIKEFVINMLTTIKEEFEYTIEFWKSTIQDLSDFLTEIFSMLWEFISNAFNGIASAIMYAMQPLADWFNANVITPITNLFNRLKPVIQKVFSDAWVVVTKIWGKIVDFFAPLLELVKQNFDTVFNAIKEIVLNVWDGIKNSATVVFNGVISSVEGLLNIIIDSINGFFEGFNDLAESASRFMGQSWEPIELFENVTLPRLASGAVIPPNNEFLAVLGDQKRGTNIETPLSTMIEAFNAAGGKTTDAELELLREQNELLRALLEKPTGITSKDIFTAVRNENRMFRKSTGVNGLI